MSHIDFQVLDWRASDVDVDVAGDDDLYTDNVTQYIIKVFGIDRDGIPISASITNFKPFFFLKPTNLSTIMTLSDIRALRKQLDNMIPGQIYDVQTVYKKDLWGFSNNKLHQFVKVTFDNLLNMRILASKFKTGSCSIHLRSPQRKIILKIYESNIEPFIRFIHIKDIKPCGWIRLPYTKYEKNDVSSIRTTCSKDYVVHWEDVQSVNDIEDIAPLKIASFDIECNSSHGDFPLAKKSYEKLSREFIQFYNFMQNDPKRKITKDRMTNYIKDALVYLFKSAAKPESNLESHFSKIFFKRPHPDIHEEILYRLSYEIYDILDDTVCLKKHTTNQDNPIDNFKSHFAYYNQADLQINDDDTKQSVYYRLNKLLALYFPAVCGDEVIQIGTTFHIYGETSCYYKHIVTLGTCDAIEGVDIVSCATEKDLLLEWTKMIQATDPDIITGYNIFGFDMKYMYDRAEELKCAYEFGKLGRFNNRSSKLVPKILSSSALGDNFMYFIDIEGRVVIDLMKIIQRDHNLDSYKLDLVAAHFIQGNIRSMKDERLLYVDNTNGLTPRSYIFIHSKGSSQKVLVEDVCHDKNMITLCTHADVQQNPLRWGLAKDDVSPNDIFKYQKGTSYDRSIIAKYCVQDCSLCNLIIIKLEIIANNIGMSNVCCVPLSYIFMRGQGVKIFSLVSKQCKNDEILIPVIKHDINDVEQDDDGYEGAIVLTPEPGIYTDEPISVLDYASLYPSSMISENISHDSIVLDKQYDYIPGIEYVDIVYDVFDGKANNKKIVGQKTCRYAQFKNNKKGVLPRILQQLLKQRKATKKRISEKRVTLKDEQSFVGDELKPEQPGTYELLCNNENLIFDMDDIECIQDAHNDFMKAVLDGLQLAYKITANSLYGQVGARTSPIYMKELAASTTATGRNLILKAKHFMETKYDAQVIYGDTDSIFVNFRLHEKLNLSGKEALQQSIQLAVKAGNEFKQAHLKHPHELEYEKTFFPFIILSKKKYVGNLYEFDVNKFKQKSMGIVLKRRDNANIVKVIYGGMIDIILNEADIKKTVRFLTQSLKDLINGKFSLDQLIITKTLRAEYKDPTKIAHKVLADRMGERDPGSKPQINDRIPFVYIVNKHNKNGLQGERIEHPSFIIKNKLKPDYAFYISNQLMKPISQLLSIVIEDLEGYRLDKYFFKNKFKSLLAQFDGDVRKTTDKISQLKMQQVEKIIFDPLLKPLKAVDNGGSLITSHFSVV
jgi:DNA polymerase elongation subunit (family B)